LTLVAPHLQTLTRQVAERIRNAQAIDKTQFLTVDRVKCANLVNETTHQVLEGEHIFELMKLRVSRQEAAAQSVSYDIAHLAGTSENAPNTEFRDQLIEHAKRVREEQHEYFVRRLHDADFALEVVEQLEKVFGPVPEPEVVPKVQDLTRVTPHPSALLRFQPDAQYGQQPPHIRVPRAPSDVPRVLEVVPDALTGEPTVIATPVTAPVVEPVVEPVAAPVVPDVAPGVAVTEYEYQSMLNDARAHAMANNGEIPHDELLVDFNDPVYFNSFLEAKAAVSASAQLGITKFSTLAEIATAVQNATKRGIEDRELGLMLQLLTSLFKEGVLVAKQGPNPAVSRILATVKAEILEHRAKLYAIEKAQGEAHVFVVQALEGASVEDQESGLEGVKSALWKARKRAKQLTRSATESHHQLMEMKRALESYRVALRNLEANCGEEMKAYLARTETRRKNLLFIEQTILPHLEGAMKVGGSISIEEQRAIAAALQKVDPELNVDGGWGPWQEGFCDAKCGLGRRTLYRECNKPKTKRNGALCSGAYIIRNMPCAVTICAEDQVRGTIPKSSRIKDPEILPPSVETPPMPRFNLSDDKPLPKVEDDEAFMNTTLPRPGRRPTPKPTPKPKPAEPAKPKTPEELAREEEERKKQEEEAAKKAAEEERKRQEAEERRREEMRRKFPYRYAHPRVSSRAPSAYFRLPVNDFEETPEIRPSRAFVSPNGEIALVSDGHGYVYTFRFNATEQSWTRVYQRLRKFQVGFGTSAIISDDESAVICSKWHCYPFALHEHTYYDVRVNNTRTVKEWRQVGIFNHRPIRFPRPVMSEDRKTVLIADRCAVAQFTRADTQPTTAWSALARLNVSSEDCRAMGWGTNYDATSVAISGDGQTRVFVGSCAREAFCNVAGKAFSLVYIFKNDQQVARVVVPTPVLASPVVNSDGSKIMIGAPVHRTVIHISPVSQEQATVGMGRIDYNFTYVDPSFNATLADPELEASWKKLAEVESRTERYNAAVDQSTNYPFKPATAASGSDIALDQSVGDSMSIAAVSEQITSQVLAQSKHSASAKIASKLEKQLSEARHMAAQSTLKQLLQKLDRQQHEYTQRMEYEHWKRTHPAEAAMKEGKLPPVNAVATKPEEHNALAETKAEAEADSDADEEGEESASLSEVDAEAELEAELEAEMEAGAYVAELSHGPSFLEASVKISPSRAELMTNAELDAEIDRSTAEDLEAEARVYRDLVAEFEADRALEAQMELSFLEAGGRARENTFESRELDAELEADEEADSELEELQSLVRVEKSQALVEAQTDAEMAAAQAAASTTTVATPEPARDSDKTFYFGNRIAITRDGSVLAVQSVRKGKVTYEMYEPSEIGYVLQTASVVPWSVATDYKAGFSMSETGTTVTMATSWGSVAMITRPNLESDFIVPKKGA